MNNQEKQRRILKVTKKYKKLLSSTKMERDEKCERNRETKRGGERRRERKWVTQTT